MKAKVQKHWPTVPCFICLALFTCSLVGCSNDVNVSTSQDSPDSALLVVSGSELREYLGTTDAPVLVEFGVDFNCSRCAQTKSDVERLRDSLGGDVDVIRVDFNANAQMVAELGGTICPTYVLFDDSNHVFTRSFPLSIDLLEGEVLRHVGK